MSTSGNYNATKATTNSEGSTKAAKGVKTTSSEDILLSVNNVRHKKNDGTLYLMEHRIAWMPNGKDTFAISHKYSDIKMQKISPEGKAKIQLQLVLTKNDTTTFQFSHPEGVNKQLADRDAVKQLLQQLLPRFRKKISRELEEKNRILQQDPDLFNLYKDLVGSKVISPDEFWTQLAPIRCPQLIKTLNINPSHLIDKPNLASSLHNSSFSANSSTVNQSVGISAAFLADIKPQADGCNGIKYNITTDIIEAIFRTYPAVKRKHFENVPHKISESEFWTRFFQSHYFHRDRVLTSATGSVKGDLFADCAKSDEIDIRNAAKRGVKDPFVDINYFDDINYINKSVDNDPKESKKESSTEVTLPSANQALIKRFNLHSIMILEASKRKTSDNCDNKVVNNKINNNSQEPPVNGTVKSKHKDKKNSENSSTSTLIQGDEIDEEEVKKIKKVRLEEKTELEDLDAQAMLDPSEWSARNSKVLSIADKQRYLEGPVISDGNSSFSHNYGHLLHHNKLSLLELIRCQDKIVNDWKLALTNCLSSAAAITALSELSPGGAFIKTSHTISLKEVIPVDIQNQLETLYFSCNELLRHFWACFPVTNPLIEEKLVQMKSTLEKFQVTKLQPFRDKLNREHLDIELTAHLLSQLQIAFNKFNSWQMKKGSSNRK